MVKFDSTTLSTRAWAIPALCGLFTHHHDVNRARLTRVINLTWSENEVQVTLQYGIGNVACHVSTSKELVVTLYRSGAVGVRERTESATSATSRIVTFLAGEVAREALRWGEAWTAWHEGDPDDADRSAILSLICAAAGIPIGDMQIVIARDRNCPSRLRGVQLKSESATVELIPVTTHGVSITVNEMENGQPKWRHYAQDDVRDAQVPLQQRRALWQKKRLTGLRCVVLLPLDFLLYLFETAGKPSAADRAGFVDHLPSSMVDAHAGKMLSALSDFAK